ncbi:protein Njmu-R1-like isoform X1 [Lytechinus pictus]|uniref:protein Njmu-R1-like isoform X1 n=1 Tax=Lytechinus pictus TaxID=7653 RepID=UPI00240E8520|nr:protein Njmu-R1-like [Lytechinus pictus]
MATSGKVSESSEKTSKKTQNEAGSSSLFAMYTYHANRPNNNQDLGPDGDRDPRKTSVPDFLQREATSNRDFSLSVIATDLNAEDETDLREFIARRLSRGTVYGGSGNVNTVDIGSRVMACYYCLLRQGGTQPGIEREIESAMDSNSFYTSQECVICFLSTPTSALELFRPELDLISEGVLPLLEQKGGDSAEIQNHLEDWYTQASGYVCRCVETLKEDVAYLINAALLEIRMEVVGTETAVKQDVERFMKACSLSDLLQSSQESSSQVPSDPILIDIDEAGNAQANVRSPSRGPSKSRLVFEGDSYRFENAEKSWFCEEWSSTMLKGGETLNPAFLRQVIEDYKLHTIQDLNTLKRLIRQAETDHYALYRAYAFLRDCGCGAILLRHIWKDENTISAKDTQNVLNVLEEFISETDSSNLAA